MTQAGMDALEESIAIVDFLESVADAWAALSGSDRDALLPTENGFLGLSIVTRDLKQRLTFALESRE